LSMNLCCQKFVLSPARSLSFAAFAQLSNKRLSLSPGVGVSPRPPQHRGVMFNAWSGWVGSYSAIRGTRAAPRCQGLYKLGTQKKPAKNLPPSIPSTPRPATRKSHAHLLYALNLSHHVLTPWRMSALAALSPRSSPSLLVALLLPLLSFPAFAQLSNKRLSHLVIPRSRRS